MKKLIGLLTLVSLLAIRSPAIGQTQPEKVEKEKAQSPVGVGGIVYGEGHSYMLSAPKGWVLDNQSGTSQGLVAVFYPVGGSWADSPSVMYSRIQPKEGKTLDEVIEKDIDYMRKMSPSIVATKQEPIAYGKDKKLATVRYLSADKAGNLEAIGYMEESNWVVLLILTARNEKDFKSCLSAFKEIVESYMYLTDKVDIKK